MEQFIKLKELTRGGKPYCLVKRISDGMFAVIKENWIEESGLVDTDGNKLFYPSSNTKAIRLSGLDWTKEQEDAR